METNGKFSGFAKYAWFTLVFNIVVIVWGVFLRASKSGDGCGQYWLTCNGEVIPSAPQFATVIEFSHRMMTAVDFFVVLLLVVWAFLSSKKGETAKKFAVISFVFIITEALIGAGLVLTGNTAGAITPYRPYWAIGHLINSSLLLAALSLTAWSASYRKTLKFVGNKRVIQALLIAVFGIFLIGSSGSLAALSGMLFPVESLAEGFRQDFADSSHILLRLRISHPILSILVGIYLIFLAGWLRKKREADRLLRRLSSMLSIFVLIQLAFGAITLLSLAPILMQLGHLLLADLVWILFVLVSATYLSSDTQNFS